MNFLCQRNTCVACTFLTPSCLAFLVTAALLSASFTIEAGLTKSTTHTLNNDNKADILNNGGAVSVSAEGISVWGDNNSVSNSGSMLIKHTQYLAKL